MAKYYEAYDLRFRQVHAKNISWFSNQPTSLILDVIQALKISKDARVLEIGCGEGRDARHLLANGYNVLATDISLEAVDYARKQDSKHFENYQVLDVCRNTFDKQFDFIYAVSVIHMLVLDEDRQAFFEFIRKNLSINGKALIFSMGDGYQEFQSDISNAFTSQERIHSITKEKFMLASTSCRIVSFAHLENELIKSNLHILKKGIISLEPDYPSLMYVLVD